MGTLREYAQYVALVRRYKTELGSLDEAVNRAVDECIRNGVLADFLRRNRAEVVMMSIFEYNQEEEERKLRAAERQAGYASGVEQGIRQGIERGMAQGIERGMAQGIRARNGTGNGAWNGARNRARDSRKSMQAGE